MDKSKNSYLGFSIRLNDHKERVLYVVDHNDKDSKIYGGYFGSSDLGEFSDDVYGSIIMEVNLFDGTMPLDIASFNEIASSDELESGCLFWEGRPLAMASILGKDEEKVPIGEVYEEDSNWLFEFMLEQCEQVRKVINNKPVKKKEEG